MPRFGKRSKKRLATCDDRLQDLFKEVIKYFHLFLWFHYFGGFVLGIASQMGLKIRWGGDWDRDTEVKDNRFDDLPHFEIRE